MTMNDSTSEIVPLALFTMPPTSAKGCVMRQPSA